MAKILTDKELLEIVRLTIEEHELDEMAVYEGFLRGLASLITDFYGGEVGSVGYDPCDELGHTVAFHGNDSVPEGGGVYARFDKEGEL